MARQLSIVVVYFADTDFASVMGTLEKEFPARLDAGDHRLVGNAEACIIDVLVPGGFDLRQAQHRLEEAMPTVGIKIMERYHESWWARRRWTIAVGIGVGIALMFIAELLRPLTARLREALG